MKNAAALAMVSLVLGCNGDDSNHADAGADVQTVIEAGPDGDNGAPSTNYPAPHPAFPVLVNAAKGPVLTAPKAYLVFYPNETTEPALKTFAQAMTTSTYWTTTTSEYGVGAFSYGGTIDLTDTPPQTISQADLQTWVGTEIQNGAFGTPDPQAIYTIVFPSTTTITQPNPVSTILGDVKSCIGFGGYHDNVAVALDDAGTTTFAYAVIPTCSEPLSEVISHEWIEAATDPELTTSGAFTLTGGPNAAFYGPDTSHSVWALLGGGEAGDLCEPEGSKAYIKPTDLGGQSVQRTWSNLAASASHDPCVPEISGAFFDSAPVLNDAVSFTSAFTGDVTSQGIVIAQGASKTIEVDLFSDGDTGGPWSVSAQDVLSTYYGTYGIKSSLSFAWDRTTGQNGEKLHLTITVTGPSPVGGAHAFMIISTLAGRTVVWPGLVVES